MPRTISRRILAATAIRRAVAWLRGYVSFWYTYSIARFSERIALYADLRCPRTIGKACLLALPAPDGSGHLLYRQFSPI